MKKYWHICFILCALILFQILVTPVAAINEDDISVTQGCRGINADVPYLGTDQKISNAEAVILYESGTDTLMYAWNADKPMYPASLVKIMTALIAVEQADISDIVTVKASSLSQIPADATSAELLADEVMTLEQLLYCLLVESANDAAAVIADHIGGSQSAFVAMMNQRAVELGCTGTNFTNPHGLHNENQITTARDMAKILTAAMKNELFRKYFGTTHYTVEATNKSEPRDLASGNHMMHKSTYEIYYDARVAGGRTGVTNSGSNCLATAAKSGNMELICIVMGSKTSFIAGTGYIDRIGGFEETTRLLDLGFNGLRAAQILYENQAVQQHTVVNGDSDLVVGPQVSISAVVPDNADLSSLNFRYSAPVTDLQAPIALGQHILDLEIWDGNVCIAYAPLYAMNAVNEAQLNILDTQEDTSGGSWGTILIILLILAILVVFCWFVLRIISTRRYITAGKQFQPKKRRVR